MKKWIYEWDRRRWLRKVGGLPSVELANTLMIADMVSRLPKPAPFQASAWLTAHREIAVEKAKLPRP